jgi:multiple sugar transport system permease protein
VIKWFDHPLITLFDTVTIPYSWPIVLLVSLYLAWAAHKKRHSGLLWLVLGVGGFIAASEIIRALIPDSVQKLERGKLPSAAFTIWSDSKFRSDFGLALIVILLIILFNSAVRRLVSYASGGLAEDGTPAPPALPWQQKASAISSALFVSLPVILWIWAALWFTLVGDYADIVLPLAGFVLLAILAGAIWARLEDWKRNAAFLLLAVIVLAAQLRYNATRPPGSMFESNGSVPFYMALFPLITGVLIVRRSLRHSHFTRTAWQLGTLLWVLALVGWAVKFMGFYDYQKSYAFALGSLFEAPIRAVVALDKLYYDLVPREIATERNIANMNDWKATLAVLVGIAVWLRLLVQVQRLPVLKALEHPFTHYFERIRSPQLSLQQRRYVLAFVLVTPAVALRTFTTFYPFVQTLVLSLQKYNPAFPPRQYIGFRNFERLSTDLVVRESLEFTLIFVFVSTFFQMFLGLAIAHLLNANFSLRGLARTVSLIPWAVPMVVAAMGFKWMFDDQFGMIPDLLRRIFDIHMKWLVDPTNARVAVVFVNVWKSTPFCALLLLAGLQGISLDLYEAAKVDGANWFDSLRFITVPMLLPIIVTVTMFMLVWQLAVFDLPFAMTGGAPGFATTVVAQKIYLEINSLNYSFASAVSVMLVVIVTVIGGLGLYTLRRVEVSA